MKYPYFRGLEADRYSFYRVPKALIKVDLFEKMSGDAKLLYAVLLDRMNLSLKNGWQDENGNAYIICTIDEIMDSIRCARQKAVKLLDELEHEYQLIERRRQGLGKPNLLYVKDLYAGLSESNYWKYENQTSGGLKSELPGVWKSNGSKTDINNTDSSETGSIDVVAAARSVLQVERDQKDTDIRIVRQIKNSLAPSDGEIRFSITAEMGFQWLECKSTFVSSEQPKVPEFESKTEKAAYLIKKLLSDGDMRAREIYMRMKDEGISRRTAENTKKELGIRSYRKMRQWYWSIHTGE